jgi:hypothetical protein
LINVSKAFLVETDGVRVRSYAALSYVWGKADEEIMTTTRNFESLKFPGRFREKDVPLLFRDAFEVCSQLGINYLWIDRICVVQDEVERKSVQLEAMGQIYPKARITIVSSEPNFINQGLPGISQPRTSPLKILVGNKILVPTAHKPRNTSTWETRGWTFQEGLLAENVLIFGRDMVYMYSRGSEMLAPEGFQESLFYKPDYISYSLAPQDKHYSDLVKEYSARILTFGSDKVNAFLGVLDCFGEHQYGLPHRIFDQAMLWHYAYEPSLSGPIISGQEFPSWSWASTVGRIEYRHLLSKDRPLFSLATWAVLQLNQASNELSVKVLDTLQLGDHSKALDHLHTIRSYVARLEAQTAYDPVVVAMAANLCERYRLIQQNALHQKEPSNRSDNVPIAGKDDPLSDVRARMKPFKKAPWFKDLEDSIRQVPQEVRVETLMRIAKGTLPNLIQKFSAAEMEAALKPGKIVVHAPKKTIKLEYTQRCFDGTHIWMIGCGSKMIGTAKLSEPRHREVVASMPQDASQDKVEAHCIALSLMACRIRYRENGREDYSNTSDSYSTVFAMIVSLPSTGYSHRLGLGFIGYLEWFSLRGVPTVTTILG